MIISSCYGHMERDEKGKNVQVLIGDEMQTPVVGAWQKDTQTQPSRCSRAINSNTSESDGQCIESRYPICTIV